jgi:dihydrolipoamide dehydrogenase
VDKMDIIVVGGGPGGYVAALRAAQLGAKVAVVEKENLGGVCLNWGCIPTKALIKTAEVFGLAQRAAEFGVLLNAPAIDWKKAQERKQKVVAQLVGGVGMLLNKAKVQVVKGTARLVSPTAVEVKLANGKAERLEARAIILATGSSPMALPIPGIENSKVLDSTSALAIESLPKSILLLGGGVIGCEFASLFNTLGVKVTVVEMMDRLCPLIEEAIGGAFGFLFQAHGIKTYLKSKVTKIEDAGNGLVVVVSAPDGEKRIECERVLAAVGRRANVANLGLDELGVKYDRAGIKVDETMRTNIPSVYAVGDCVGGMMLAHLASRQGEVAAENIMGHKSAMSYRAVPSCIFTSPEAASVGLSETDARKAGYSVKVGLFPLNSNGKALIEGESDGFVKVVADAKYGEVLGVHIVGPHASDLILEGTLGMTLENTTVEFDAMIHPHPTLGEAVAEAMLAVDNRAVHLLR